MHNPSNIYTFRLWRKLLRHQNSFNGLGNFSFCTKAQIDFDSPEACEHDWIGPRDKDSNIRPFRFAKPANESKAARDYRELREDAQRWHMNFWGHHNRQFLNAKEKYIEEKLRELNAGRTDEERVDKLDPEQLSVFFKQFLDQNKEVHRQYNRAWYRKNFALVMLGLQVKFSDTFRRNER